MIASGALEGLRVLDLTRYIPGPYCTMLLGDLGADVVKVEQPPVGDGIRAVPPAAGETSAVHAALDRNKRSILVDVRAEAGAALVKRLAEQADVFVAAFRPGVLERRGLGAGALLAANPRLVYCSLTGYGSDGPLAPRAGHDVDYQARAGLLGISLDPERGPVLPTAQLADMAGGMMATIAILAALQARERTGRGQVVDASIFESALALMTVPAVRRLAGGPVASELTGTHACYRVFRCRDGRFLAVGALEPKFWEGLCRALGRPDLVPRQWSGGPRQEETVRELARVFAGRDRDAWIETLSSADVCVEPVLDLDEALGQEQVAARGIVTEEPCLGGRFRGLRSPLRLSETPPRLRRPAPALGADTEAVLGEAGYDPAAIEDLRRQGALP